MENLIIICIVIGLVIALWNVIRIVVGIAGFLLMVYVYSFFTPPETNPIAEVEEQIQTPKSEDPKPNQLIGAESIQVNKVLEKTVRTEQVEVHHYFHNTPEELEEIIASFDRQNNTDYYAERIVPAKRNQMDYCNNIPFEGDRLFIREGFYKSAQEAQDKINFLEENGIRGARIIWLPCYQIPAKYEYFVVVLGRPCKSLNSAKKYNKDYENKLRAADVFEQELGILSVERKEMDSPQKSKKEEIVEGFFPSFYSNRSWNLV